MAAAYGNPAPGGPMAPDNSWTLNVEIESLNLELRGYDSESLWSQLVSHWPQVILSLTTCDPTRQSNPFHSVVYNVVGNHQWQSTTFGECSFALRSVTLQTGQHHIWRTTVFQDVIESWNVIAARTYISDCSSHSAWGYWVGDYPSLFLLLKQFHNPSSTQLFQEFWVGTLFHMYFLFETGNFEYAPIFLLMNGYDMSKPLNGDICTLTSLHWRPFIY